MLNSKERDGSYFFEILYKEFRWIQWTYIHIIMIKIFATQRMAMQSSPFFTISLASIFLCIFLPIFIFYEVNSQPHRNGSFFL